jgi:hypothetical protein
MSDILTSAATATLSLATNSPQLTTFTFQLPVSGSVAGNFPSDVLSGSSTLFSGSLAAGLSGYNGSLVTNSTSVVFTISGRDGLNNYDGYVAGGTYSPANSSIIASFRFFASGLQNTVINVSANPTRVNLNADNASVVDVPGYYTPGTSPEPGSSNYIRTVSNFLRLWNLNG